MAVGAAVLVVLSLLAAKHLSLPAYLAETLAGLAVYVIIVHYTLAEGRDDRRPFGLGFLKHRWVLPLGVFSYSIYLIHSPLLGLLNLLMLELPLPADLRLVLMLTVAVPLALLLSYGFYCWSSAASSPGTSAPNRKGRAELRPSL